MAAPELASWNHNSHYYRLILARYRRLLLWRYCVIWTKPAGRRSR